jgi:hypothetical protein
MATTTRNLSIHTVAGFEFCDLDLGYKVEEKVLLTEGACVSGVGTIYGVFDSVWHATREDADDRTIATLGADSLPQELRDLAARNSERLETAQAYKFATDGDSGRIVATDWGAAKVWLEGLFTQAVIEDGGWGWVEHPDGSRHYVGKENRF